MDIRDVYQDGAPTNSFRDYLCNKLKKSKRVVEEMLIHEAEIKVKKPARPRKPQK